jgi:hypothetical protein
MAKKKVTYRKIHMSGPGFAADRLQDGPDIDGLPGRVGDLVFLPWSHAPHWICEWQPDNGQVFSVIDAIGNHTMVGPEDLTRNSRNIRRK